MGTTTVRACFYCALGMGVGRSLRELTEFSSKTREQNEWVRAGTSSTSIFMYPGYEFKVVDKMFTNFHTPESTLIMLVSAFAGREHILSAYKQAVENKYRFFSYGDCMFIR